ncbi:MAG TPA: hypothetical protein VNL94_07190, partial [Candidatus Binatia bacterium]|nr:hypothetical protein [Candidatus Binatia bacterium]
PAASPLPDRTIVLSEPGTPGLRSRSEPPPRPRVSTTVPIGAAAGAVTTLVETGAEAPAAPEPGAAPGRARPASPLERILRGEHRAMVELLDRLAGEDGARRREWELLLGGLVEAMAAAAVEEAVVDFPMGTAFWDTFTVEQCRRIVGALASMGFVYDGGGGWVDQRVPAYRDLTQALADVGIDPLRIRRWPNSTEIATLFVGARPAPEELLAAAGPDYEADAMRELLGARGEALRELWLAWDAVRPVLLEEPASIEDVR